jgi:quinol-cytochrome oxidoreductase complex cytochrome b subunit
MIFAKRADFCAKVKAADKCPTKAYWTLLKWISAFCIVLLLIILFCTWKLYEAINHYNANMIRRWLKIIAIIFVIYLGFGIWMDTRPLKGLIIETIISIVFNVLFVWYTCTLATALDKISEDADEITQKMSEWEKTRN